MDQVERDPLDGGLELHATGDRLHAHDHPVLVLHRSNQLTFRQRRPITRALLSLTLSISLTPILTYLAARWLSFGVVWALYGLTWAVCAGIAVQHRRALQHLHLPQDRLLRIALAIALIWVVIAACSLVDVQIGHRLYFSVTSYDYTKNISVTDAITRTGVPPINPSFHRFSRKNCMSTSK